MRALVAVLLLGGCLGVTSSGGGGARPGVMPMLSELPGDAAKRDAILDQSNVTAGPEHRPGMTVKERKAETAAATAAAIIGSMFSKTQTTTLGAATSFEESPVAAPHPVKPGPPAVPPSALAPEGAADPDAPPDDPGTSNADLIPWIKLK